MVLQSGHIIDTIVYGISIPLTKFPAWIASEAMLVVQTLLNFLIPSGSGQAVTSMPIMAPLADLVGVFRQVAVLAFQFGDGLSNIIWPTAMAPIMCGIAGVQVEKWWKIVGTHLLSSFCNPRSINCHCNDGILAFAKKAIHGFAPVHGQPFLISKNHISTLTDKPGPDALCSQSAYNQPLSHTGIFPY